MEKARLSAPGRPLRLRLRLIPMLLLLSLPDLQNLCEPVENVRASVTAPMASPSHALVSFVLVSSIDGLAALAEPPLAAVAVAVGGENARLL
jgi:hypothetical protein